MDNESLLKKLEVLLQYWIDHNNEHGEEFKDWASRIREMEKRDISEDILEAVKSIEDANRYLYKALEALKSER